MEDSIFIPFGDMSCDSINSKLSSVKDNKAFILLRDILCCVKNSGIDIDIVLNLFIKNNLTVDDIYNTLKKYSIDWYKIFSITCDYKTLCLSHNKLEDKQLSASPYDYKFKYDILRAVPRSTDGGLSAEVIMHLDEMMWLNHSTCFDCEDDLEDLDKIKSIFADGYLKISSREEQYPGIYTTLCTKYNVNSIHRHKFFIHFIFPLSLLKSAAWHANIKENYGTIHSHTIDSSTMLDYILSDIQSNISFDEVVFQYNLSIDLAVHIVCPSEYYNLLKPIIGEKLISSEYFKPRRYIDDLYLITNYNRQKLRLDYSPTNDYDALISITSLYNILLNSGRNKKEAKHIIRTVDQKKLMLQLHNEFWNNYRNGIIPDVVIHN